MQTTTDLANFALAALGAGQINSITDPGDAAILCNAWVNDAIETVLLEGLFQETIIRVKLQSTVGSLDEWQYGYQLPNDCIKQIKVMKLADQATVANGYIVAMTSSAASSSPMFSNSPATILLNEAEFYMEGSVLYTNSSPIIVQYVQFPENLADLPVKVNQAIGYYLATLVGPGLSIDLQKLATVEGKYLSTLGKAGRFAKRDRQYPIPRRQWGDPT